MAKWVKVYFTKEQFDEWKSGNGRAIGYSEADINTFREMERQGIDCDLKSDPLNHMTKVPPEIIRPVVWSPFGVYVR